MHSRLVRRIPQLAALAAAARQEIVDVLEQLGTVSVGELADALGRPADALYFHLRALARVGLVRQAGYRARAGRKEALYRTVKPALQLAYEPGHAGNRHAVTRIVASMLRLANRDFQRSFRHGHVAVSGAHRELWAWRKVGRLSPEQLGRLNQRVQGLAQDVSATRRDGRLYAVTLILTPLDHRNNVVVSKARRPRKSRRAAGRKKP